MGQHHCGHLSGGSVISTFATTRIQQQNVNCVLNSKDRTSATMELEQRCPDSLRHERSENRLYCVGKRAQIPTRVMRAQVMWARNHGPAKQIEPPRSPKFVQSGGAQQSRPFVR